MEPCEFEEDDVRLIFGSHGSDVGITTTFLDEAGTTTVY